MTHIARRSTMRISAQDVTAPAEPGQHGGVFLQDDSVYGEPDRPGE